MRTGRTQSLFPANMLDILKNLASPRNTAISRDIDSLKSLAEEDGDGQLTTTLKDLAQDFADLKSDGKDVIGAVSQAPARADNPYKDETDIGKLKKLLKNTEKKIEETIINQRNKEAAESFAEALSATKKGRHPAIRRRT